MMVIGLAAEAKATSWNLNNSNVDLGISGNFATVNVNVAGSTANFSVNANETLLGAGSNFGIDKFFFNSTISTLSAADFVTQSGWEVITGSNASSFGTFEFQYKGNGSSRINPLAFSVTNSNITSALNFYEANANGNHFVAHIAGFPMLNGQTSAYFSDMSPAPVPEPSTIILFAAGLAGLAYMKKRSAKKAEALIS
jgi:hypothetical protein